MASIQVFAPTFEQHHNGLGITSPAPRISWRFSFTEGLSCEWRQQAYELEIKFVDSIEAHTFKVASDNSILEPWPARHLTSREDAHVRVRCYASPSAGGGGRGQEVTDWSPWSAVETGLLDASDWSASMIAASPTPMRDDGALRPLRFSRTFDLPKGQGIRKARLYITAQGCYTAKINGRVVGDHRMAPGWQSYKHRLHYQVFDVKELLQDGRTTIDVDVAPGWFAGALAWAGGRRCVFGPELGVLAQLHVTFEDDRVEPVVLGSDDQWQWEYSSITSSEIYDGETYDMNSHVQAFQHVKLLHFDHVKLVSPNTPPVRVTGTISPVRIFESNSGKTIIDFGQNLVGVLQVSGLRKPAGHVVKFRHAEVMEDGELGVRPLRDAKATDTIICNGETLNNWSPQFTFHGFRYVEVSGWGIDDADCPLTPSAIAAQVLHSDMRRTGWFSCSHPLVNKLHENALWSMRGNFLSLPTDCPQRNERLGWTGDIQVFAPSANFLYDTTGMLGNWLDDVAVEQMEPWREGIPPFVVPDVITKAFPEDDDFWPHLPNAVWDDAVILVPWSLYLASGDKQVLEKQFESMTAWVDKGIRRGPDYLWDPSIYQLGDWLDPMASPDEPGNGRTDGTFVADAYLVRVTAVMAETCAALGRSGNADRYRKENRRLKESFIQKYVAKSGLLVSDTQTALSLAIVFNLLDDTDQLTAVGQRLARSVRLQQFRVSTGFAGTPIITHALTMTHNSPLAYRMLLEKNCPSWMYPISMGATTIWERWDSMLPDGSINPGEMTSFNHYALGSIVNWLHECVGGISPLEPGWKQIKIRPVPGGGLTHADVAHESPYGRIECSWRTGGKEEGRRSFHLEVLVPPNSSAWVVLPDEQKKTVKGEEERGRWVWSGRHVFDVAIDLPVWPPEPIMPPFWPQKKPQLT